jgi:hypothetical protein
MNSAFATCILVRWVRYQTRMHDRSVFTRTTRSQVYLTSTVIVVSWYAPPAGRIRLGDESSRARANRRRTVAVRSPHGRRTVAVRSRYGRGTVAVWETKHISTIAIKNPTSVSIPFSCKCRKRFNSQTATVPRPYRDRTATVPRPYGDRTATVRRPCGDSAPSQMPIRIHLIPTQTHCARRAHNSIATHRRSLCVYVRIVY